MKIKNFPLMVFFGYCYANIENQDDFWALMPEVGSTLVTTEFLFTFNKFQP